MTRVQATLAAPSMPPEELYDLHADADETNNLAGSPAHADVLKRLRGVLEKWIDETNDQGRKLEPTELAANKGVTKTNTHPNTGYTLDGKPPGAQAAPTPAKRP